MNSLGRRLAQAATSLVRQAEAAGIGPSSASAKCSVKQFGNSSAAWCCQQQAARFASGPACWNGAYSGPKELPFALRAHKGLKTRDAPGSIVNRFSSSAGREPKQKATAAELGMYWTAAAVAMIGVSYASVPLYRMFCAATGYGGVVKAGHTVEDKLKKRLENPDPKVEQAAANREITVWFNGDVADDLPWTFKPTQDCVRVKPGQSTLVFFMAKNLSDKPITGYSLYFVTPDKAAVYFNKIQCFCFEEQRLRGGEEVDMPVLFYLDPEMATDWNCRNINDITLSYNFKKVDADYEEDEEDDGKPTVVKVHSGPHPPGLAPIPRTAAAKAT